MDTQNHLEEEFNEVRWTAFIKVHWEMSDVERKEILTWLKMAFDEGQSVGWRQGYRDS